MRRAPPIKSGGLVQGLGKWGGAPRQRERTGLDGREGRVGGVESGLCQSVQSLVGRREA